MRTISLALALALLATPAVAACPPTPDLSVREARLLLDVRAAQSEREARPIVARLWEVWMTAPDEAAQALLDEGMRRRLQYDFLGAEDAFTRLVDYCPEYHEGYNQRAFVAFLTERYEDALTDLERALELRPTHVGAISGRGLTLIRLGRERAGLAELRRAVKLNPWIPERGLIDGLVPQGDDL